MNVYFNINPNTRQRIWETLSHLPQGIQPVLPKVQKKPDTQVSGLQTSWLIHLTKNIIGGLGWPNARWVSLPKDQPVDFIYAPGHLTLNYPYITELDNPLVLSFYEIALFNQPIVHFLIERLLTSQRCRGIICISKICQKGFLSYFPQPVIAQKTWVVYPFVEPNPYPRKTSQYIRLLFISTSFYLKGGRELIKTYLILKKKFSNLRLTIVTKISPKIKRDYGGLDGIQLVEANYSKDELYKYFYCDADIFVVPSYQDSFGMVFLEAVASGLAIVSTKMYAIPEIVEEGENGLLLDPPFKLWGRDGTTSPKLWRTDLYDITERQEFPEIIVGLERMLGKLIKNVQLRKSFARHSLELVQKGKFSNKNRLKKLSEVIGHAVLR